MLSALLAGTFSFSAFAEGFSAVIVIYSLYKNSRKDSAEHGNTIDRKNVGGQS